MKKILIIDDDVDTLEVFATILSSRYEVKAVVSRDDAIGVINAGFVPVCVMTDYKMPGMTLEEFIRQSEQHDLKIVLLTGYTDTIKVSELYEISSFLQKPTTSDAILKVLKSVVGE